MESAIVLVDSSTSAFLEDVHENCRLFSCVTHAELLDARRMNTRDGFLDTQLAWYDGPFGPEVTTRHAEQIRARHAFKSDLDVLTASRHYGAPARAVLRARVRQLLER